jgi:hypothetical protein
MLGTHCHLEFLTATIHSFLFLRQSLIELPMRYCSRLLLVRSSQVAGPAIGDVMTMGHSMTSQTPLACLSKRRHEQYVIYPSVANECCYDEGE